MTDPPADGVLVRTVGLAKTYGRLGSFGQGGDKGIGLDRKAYAEGQAAGRSVQFQQGVGGGRGGVGTRAIGAGR